MHKAFLFGAMLLAAAANAQTAASAPAAANIAAPLGLELGKTKCARMTPGPGHEKAGTAQWAGGDAIEIKRLDRFNLPGLSRVIVNCDAQDNVALITMTFERSALDEVSSKLDARYTSRRKTDANAENAYAEWTAANGSLELLYARDGKQFTVAYWSKGAKAKYFAYKAGSSNSNSSTGNAGATGKPTAAAPQKQPAAL